MISPRGALSMALPTGPLPSPRRPAPMTSRCQPAPVEAQLESVRMPGLSDGSRSRPSSPVPCWNLKVVSSASAFEISQEGL
ncbi:hypothetical protein NDU88_005827, partial [Pleurodeles waltl]